MDLFTTDNINNLMTFSASFEYDTYELYCSEQYKLIDEKDLQIIEYASTTVSEYEFNQLQSTINNSITYTEND